MFESSRHPSRHHSRGDAKAELGSPRLAASGLLQCKGSRWTFRDANAKRLIRLGLHGWRADLHEGRLPTDPAKREGGPFRELSLTKRTDDKLLENSVMLLDDLLNAAECAMLIAATDAWCDSVPDSVNDETGEKMELRRIECHPDGINLNGESHALAFTIMSRALWNLQHMKPDLVKKIFPERGGRFPEHLADMSIKFSWNEPYINRYTASGAFKPHTDGEALSILVPLSRPDVDFRGGGTAFWSGKLEPDVASVTPPSLVLRPAAGTAIFWRGHITHAGLAVTEGVRHIFVASFTLRHQTESTPQPPLAPGFTSGPAPSRQRRNPFLAETVRMDGATI